LTKNAISGWGLLSGEVRGIGLYFVIRGAVAWAPKRTPLQSHHPWHGDMPKIGVAERQNKRCRLAPARVRGPC